jgi:hypothetical protein
MHVAWRDLSDFYPNPDPPVQIRQVRTKPLEVRAVSGIIALLSRVSPVSIDITCIESKRPTMYPIYIESVGFII